MAIIFHIDVNSAYLSWTAAAQPVDSEHPDLRTIPSIIGGDEKSRHGVVLAKSSPAKAYGIRTGEPVAAALKKCPFLVVAPPDHTLYRRRSKELMDLLHTYTSDLEQLSIDECFMDFTPIAHLFSSPIAAARQIQEQIREQLGFTVNIGISVNRLLAKMASDFQKPNRIHTLYPEEIPIKMWPLAVEELYTVGRSSAEKLHKLGLHTIGDLALSDPDFLCSHFKSHGLQMWNYANGQASDVIHSEKAEVKNVGNSITLSSDVTDREAACRVLLSLAETVSFRLRKEKLLAQSVTVEIKYSDFTSCSHQCPLLSATNATDSLYQAACRLFDELWKGMPIRLLGIRTAKLVDEHTPVQLSFFDLEFSMPGTSDSGTKKRSTPSREKQQKLDQAMDAIRKRFGEEAIVRGSFLKPPKSSKTSGTEACSEPVKEGMGKECQETSPNPEKR